MGAEQHRPGSGRGWRKAQWQVICSNLWMKKCADTSAFAEEVWVRKAHAADDRVFRIERLSIHLVSSLIEV
jgi:hypothetical protein